MLQGVPSECQSQNFVLLYEFLPAKTRKLIAESLLCKLGKYALAYDVSLTYINFAVFNSVHLDFFSRGKNLKGNLPLKSRLSFFYED